MLAALALDASNGGTRPLVNAARAVAEPLEREYLPLAIETTKAAIARSARMPAIGKLSLHNAIVEDRWRGLAALESVGERLGRAARLDGVDQRIVAGAHVLVQALGRTDDAAAGAFVAGAAGSAADAADWLAATVSTAAALVEEALARLARAGIAITKLSVAEESGAARRLYERLGFTVYGREPAGYRWRGRDWTLLLMRRELDPPLS